MPAKPPKVEDANRCDWGLGQGNRNRCPNRAAYTNGNRKYCVCHASSPGSRGVRVGFWEI